MTTLREGNTEYIPKIMENVNCLFCGADNHKIHERFGHKKQYSYVQCRKCALIYLNPRPKYDEEFLEIAYDEYGKNSYHVLNNGQLSDDERKGVEKEKRLFQEIEDKIGRKGKILDIGCATGLFLYGIRELGWEVTGIDISVPMINFTNDIFKIEAYAGQYEDIDLGTSGPFDVIYCSHVIEHIPNPYIWMSKFKKDLTPEGILCLQIPNQYSLGRVIQRFLKNIKLRKNKWAIWRTPDHLFEPHAASLKYLIDKCGYNIVDMYTYSRKTQDRKLTWPQLFFHHTLKLGSNYRLLLKSA